MPLFCRPFTALLFSLLILPLAHAETFTGKVVKVLDGDTVDVLVDRTPRRVRLAGIDAPEKAQPFGSRAKQQLAALVGGQVVEVQADKTDRYGRTVGKVLVEGRDANLAMIEAGLAWWYRKYASEQPAADRASYEAAEDQARADRRGLWTDPAPVPPSEFRHAGGAGGGSAGAPGAGAPGGTSTAADCPCGSGAICTGPKGGQFCVTPEGKKRYSHAH
jgi:micrococcal nuclease